MLASTIQFSHNTHNHTSKTTLVLPGFAVPYTQQHTKTLKTLDTLASCVTYKSFLKHSTQKKQSNHYHTTTKKTVTVARRKKLFSLERR